MVNHDHSKCEPNEETKAAMLEAYKMDNNDYEIFIADKNNNTILSLDKDEVYFFNTTNFDIDDFTALKDNNIDHLIKKELALKLDSQMIYRMYLGLVNKNTCTECKRRIGNDENNKGFGNLTA